MYSEFRAIEGAQLGRVAEKLRNKVGNLEAEKYSVMQKNNAKGDVSQLQKLSDRTAKINDNAKRLSKQAGQPTATAYGSAQRKHLEKLASGSRQIQPKEIAIKPRAINPNLVEKQAEKTGSVLAKIGQKVKKFI